MADATIVIVARNAGRTVERAIRSAAEQGNWPVLLVDDQSTDATAAIAAGNHRVRVERLAEHRTLGYARQRAIDLVETEFMVLLDADDELLPGRTERLVEAMRAECTQMAFDGAEVRHGESGNLVREVPVPAFMLGRRVPARLFERNHLPIVGPVAFRTEWVRSIGYDVEMQGAEDVDLVLRGIVAGGECSLIETIGYRLYTYPHSLSRQIENQRSMLRYALNKHDDAVIERVYLLAGYDSRTTAWGLVSVALFRDDFQAAADRLYTLSGEAFPPAAIAEPNGPYPYPEGWRLDFQMGTVALLQAHPEEAVKRLMGAERQRQTPEGANNLGIAHFRLGQPHIARELFAIAMERYPGYRDARLNAEAAIPQYITTHPFRAAPSRHDYPAHS